MRERADDWHVPPWQLPGNFRLDAEPHSGPLVRDLANAAWVGAVLSHACLPVCCLGAPALVVGAVALCAAFLGAVLAPAAWLLAGRDLAGMEAGRIDRRGEGEAHFARQRGRVAFVLAVVAGLLWGWLLDVPSFF
jgi:hypothetical protein